MRAHRCNWIGCRELVPQGSKFCPIHQVANDKQREHYQQELSQSLKGTRRERHLNQVSQAKYDAEVIDQDATAFYHSRRWVKLSKYVKVRQGYTSEVSGMVLNDSDCQVDHVIKTAIENKMIRDGKSNVLTHLDKQWWMKVIREKLQDK